MWVSDICLTTISYIFYLFIDYFSLLLLSYASCISCTINICSGRLLLELEETHSDFLRTAKTSAGATPFHPYDVRQGRSKEFRLHQMSSAYGILFRMSVKIVIVDEQMMMMMMKEDQKENEEKKKYKEKGHRK